MDYLDEFMEWYAGINADVQAAGVDRALVMFGEAGLRLRFEEFVDQLVIANPNNYKKLFPAELAQEQAKVRYRLLIRLFHPDRGEKNQAWLNFRAERVNSAYQAYIDTEVEENAGPSSTIRMARPETRASQLRKTNSKPRWAIRYRKEQLRKWLGDPEELQKRIVWSLAGVAVVIVLMFLISTL
eukprot:Plantae.Rhodophyta-Hildenbrandia_rubra.ctg1086.p2 GENE.Plantae.Rhodophyta-Hildenbrandia_rubra.ctg1086~~Plantae.Rhodophyta-Hildenbrandia_rubra.ctg1086.p2  ORF type:complete len:184 (-),score=13.38 Plantae.Rhodophyta-Hildenbrandia_rubra.ctg1086:1791-2342(-)